jgi:hypothetical protein
MQNQLSNTQKRKKIAQTPQKDQILSLHDIEALPAYDRELLFEAILDGEEPIRVQQATTLLGYCVLTTHSATYH